MTAAIVTVDRPTVLVRELARAIGVAPLERDVIGHAAAHGVQLRTVRDWAGRPAVTADDAAALVAAIKTRATERATAKRRAEAERNAVTAERERSIAAAAREAYQSAFEAGVRRGDRDVELRAWLASVNAGLERQAQLAEAEQSAAAQPPRRRRWWER
jgi:flagellar biosynthesis/type III secretory pathway protein FliH